jgi:hypothetical protein
VDAIKGATSKLTEGLRGTTLMNHQSQCHCITVFVPAAVKPNDPPEAELRFPRESGDAEFAGRSFIRACAKAFEAT